MSRSVSRSELRHELRGLLRTLEKTLRRHRCHRALRHVIAAVIREMCRR
jgi:hypothetical protein